MPYKEECKIGGKCEKLTSELKQLLTKWCELQSKYAKLEQEAAYDHSEAANSSLLVSAANSLENWCGIAEHWVERKPRKAAETTKQEHKKANVSRGLLDVYISTNDRGYIIEMKQAWPAPDARHKNNMVLTDKGAAKLRESRSQIEQMDFKKGLVRHNNITALYGTYLVPYTTKDTFTFEREEIFEATIAYCDRKKFDVYAVFAPELEKEDLTVGKRKSYRPVVAMGLQQYCSCK